MRLKNVLGDVIDGGKGHLLVGEVCLMQCW